MSVWNELTARERLLRRMFELVPEYWEKDFEQDVPELLDKAIAEAVQAERARWLAATDDMERNVVHHEENRELSGPDWISGYESALIDVRYAVGVCPLRDREGDPP